MLKMQKTLLAVGCVLAFSTLSYAGDSDNDNAPVPAASSWLKGTTEQQLKTLADIQPGLGTIMIEYSRRFTAAYYAAKGGNWGMADYQLKEMPEIQEVGEYTRPARAPMLKAFEQSGLAKLMDATKAKDWKKFQVAFKGATEGCNGCHAANGFDFIKYELPKSSPSPTSNKP
jgi:hypothetical protein